jgi:hypothetical protein
LRSVSNLHSALNIVLDERRKTRDERKSRHLGGARQCLVDSKKPKLMVLF